MVTIYHNPRCSKSREGLNLLESLGVEYKIVKYIDTPLHNDEIEALLEKLEIQPIDLVRQNEHVWKQNYAGNNLTKNQIISALAEHSSLIQRPIVEYKGKAIIARPFDKITGLLNLTKI